MASGFAFQAFTVKGNGILDKIVTDLSVCPAFDPANPPNPVPAEIATQALWDTGATRSVISADLAKALGLVPVGQTQVNHAGGLGNSPTYMVNFRLPHKVLVAGVLVTELYGVHGFGAIVGMDVIGLGDFALTNCAGQTWMSFRMPSCEGIDYVGQAEAANKAASQLKFAGIGRNDPCPCGAVRPGFRTPKKFKNCHGAAV